MGDLERLVRSENEIEAFLARRLHRMLYQPLLYFGGYQVEKNIRLLKKLKDQQFGGAKLSASLKAWGEVHAHYYSCKPLTDKSKDFQPMQELKAKCKEEKDWDRHHYAQLILDGNPERVANFEVQPFFLLEKADGTRDRMLKVVNANKEPTKLIPMDAESYSAPSKLRIWLANAGNFAWMAGERELNRLQYDLSDAMFGMHVEQVSAFGFHPTSKLWFFRDCAVRSNPTTTLAESCIYPDEDGVVWFKDRGYMLLGKGGDNQDWRQSQQGSPSEGNPSMHPEIHGVKRSADGGYEASAVADDAVLRDFFVEFSDRLRKSLCGGLEAYLLLGSVLSFSIAPDLFTRESWFPGIWIHGPTSTGKSTLARWLMEIFGFHDMGDGLGLQKSCTAVGMQIAMEQYSDLPVWFNEFKQDQVEAQKLAIIHAAFNREASSKWSADGIMRKIRTNLIITGETTTTNAGTRNRYIHCQTSGKWASNEVPWMSRHKRLFFLFGRHVLLHRAEYWERVDGIYKQWLESVRIPGADERAKGIHGIAYAGFSAMTGLLESHSPDQLTEFRAFTEAHCGSAVQTVISDVNVNKFWDDVMALFDSGDLMDIEKVFKVVGKSVENPPGAPNQGYWRNYQLSIHPGNITGALRTYLRKQNRALSLEVNDLKDQMSREDYWIKDKQQRFGSGAGNTRCWTIDLDKHPMGRLPATDEEVAAARNGDIGMSENDPRKGPLFGIVSALEKVKAAKK